MNAYRLQLIEPLGEQLGQLGLRSVNAKTAIQIAEFGFRKIEGVRSLALIDQAFRIGAIAGQAADQGRIAEQHRARGLRPALDLERQQRQSQAKADQGKADQAPAA